ncbi:MAG: hypothetical protein JW797_02130 [Bradymonadales bacterium]|nr:hypothetical protein [Bradymonadales bacterium]
MITEASQRALEGLRDLSTIQWYIIPLLAIVLYIYAVEIKRARETKNWDAVFAGLTLFGMDFINETWNGVVFHLTQRSAVWTTPGPTALRTMVGWNIEIMFMFAISGIVYYHTLSSTKEHRILGVPNRWFWGFAFAVFCVFVEVLLNIGDHLVWEYRLWNRSFAGIWLIFLFGYFHFYVAIILVLALKTNRAKVIAISSLYAIAVVANVLFLGILGWVY